MKVYKPTWQPVISSPWRCHVLHFSYYRIVEATFEHLKFFPNPFQDKSFCSVLPEKENKKLKIEQLAT